MKDLLIKIEQKIPVIIQLAILVFLGLVHWMNVIQGKSRLMIFLSSSIPIFLGVLSVILLSLSKKTLLAHLTLYLLFFKESLFQLFRSITSYNFKFEFFGTKPDFMMVIYAIIEIYLIIMIIAHLIKSKMNLNYQYHQVWLIFGGFVLYFLVFNNLQSLVPIGVLILLMMLSKEYLIALLLILYCFVGTPFIFIERILTKSLSGFSIHFYMKLGLEIVITFFLVYYLILFSGLSKKLIKK